MRERLSCIFSSFDVLLLRQRRMQTCKSAITRETRCIKSAFARFISFIRGKYVVRKLCARAALHPDKNRRVRIFIRYYVTCRIRADATRDILSVWHSAYFNVHGSRLTSPLSHDSAKSHRCAAPRTPFDSVIRRWGLVDVARRHGTPLISGELVRNQAE